MKSSLPKENKNNVLVYLAVFAILIFVFDKISPLRLGLQPVYNFIAPISYSGMASAQSIKEIKTNYQSYFTTKDEVESLKKRIEQLEIKDSDYESLLDKYNSLLNSTKTSDRKYRYIQASVYFPPDGSSLILNVGSDNGVELGDVVVLGNSYVGLVTQVDKLSSKVMMADSSQSTLEVTIKKRNSDQSIKAIAVGRNFEINIENILSNSSVTNGNLVYVSDKRVGDNLLLGEITDLNKDSAATVVTAKVSPSVDVSKYNFVYVRK